MTRNIDQTKSLRLALTADAIASGAMGLLLVVAARPLAEPLGPSAGFLTAVGMVLVPFAAFVAWTGLRPNPPRAAVLGIVMVNALWTVASVATAVAGWFSLTGLGTAFVLGQAAAVAVLALWQGRALPGALTGASLRSIP